ncbi:N-acetyltransferase 8-like [Ornithorhynchus anatinus]|uniref:N-acetyltransferase 8-like n=1 Tax=Ornithorhynchus anatinus TaxID=9258 RepID=UPI00015554F0|nr:N-acetyltransferase 8-like [Ornithorhynchus anatinus]
MAHFRIRRYREEDFEAVWDIFTRGTLEHVPVTFRHLLKQARTYLLLLGILLALFVGSEPIYPVLLALPVLSAATWFIIRLPWSGYLKNARRTDMSDIRKFYLSEEGSCFWVAESSGRVVGMVGCLPEEGPPRGEKKLRLLHMFVDQGHRGQGIAKALARTLLQFARARGYTEVILTTSSVQYAAQRFYEGLGFLKVGESFWSLSWRLVAIPFFHYKYPIPSLP